MAPNESCLPGDFTVTRIPAGFVIGRVLAPVGEPPWWELVQTAPDVECACKSALELANAARTRAWMHVRDRQYDPIQNDVG